MPVETNADRGGDRADDQAELDLVSSVGDRMLATGLSDWMSVVAGDDRSVTKRFDPWIYPHGSSHAGPIVIVIVIAIVTGGA